jgi:hypothetical protein
MSCHVMSCHVMSCHVPDGNGGWVQIISSLYSQLVLPPGATLSGKTTSTYQPQALQIVCSIVKKVRSLCVFVGKGMTMNSRLHAFLMKANSRTVAQSVSVSCASSSGSPAARVCVCVGVGGVCMCVMHGESRAIPRHRPIWTVKQQQNDCTCFLMSALSSTVLPIVLIGFGRISPKNQHDYSRPHHTHTYL